MGGANDGPAVMKAEKKALLRMNVPPRGQLVA